MMTTRNDPRPATNRVTVLVIEDEPEIRQAYERWLGADYEVRAAATGSDALSQIDHSVDVVLLDRLLPDTSGDALLTKLRSRNQECRVAIVSSVEPDFDILAMGFDLYIEKPITDPEQLQDAVESLAYRSQFDTKMQEFLSLASKKATLETKKTPQELSNNQEYGDLLNQLRDLRSELHDVTSALNDEDLRVAFSRSS